MQSYFGQLAKRFELAIWHIWLAMKNYMMYYPNYN